MRNKAFLIAMLCASTAAAQVQPDTNPYAQGVARNAYQQIVEQKLARLDDACRKQNFYGSQYYATEFSEPQKTAMMNMVDSLRLEWTHVIPAGWGAPVRNPTSNYILDANVQELDQSGAWVQIPAQAKNGDGQWKPVADSERYRLLMLTCGTLVFHKQKPCGVSTEWKDSINGGQGTMQEPWRLIKMYPPTISPQVFAEHLVLDQQLSILNATQMSGEAALFIAEMFPFGGAIRTILEKGVFKYEKLDMVGDGLQVSTSILVDAIPYVSQIKKLRGASKYLWATAAAGQAARAGRNVYLNGTPDLTDVAQTLVLAVILRDVRRGSMAEEILGSSGLRMFAHELPNAPQTYAQRVNTAVVQNIRNMVSKLTAVTIADVRRAFHLDGVYDAVIGQVKSLTAKLRLDPEALSKGTIVLGEPVSPGVRKWGNMVIDQSLTIQIPPSEFNAEIAVIKAQMEAAMGNFSSRAQAVEFYAEKFFRENVIPRGVWPEHATSYYFSAATNTVHIPNVMIRDVRMLSMADEFEAGIVRAHSRIQLEEILHGVGGQFGVKGYTYRIGARDFDYVPLNPQLVKFEAWLSTASPQQLAAMGAGGTSKADLLNKIYEADAYLWHLTNGLNPPQNYVDAYKIRNVLEAWLQNPTP